MRKLLYFFFLLSVSFFSAQAQPKQEIRATWITTLGGMDWPKQRATSREKIQRQRQEFCQLLDQLKAAHFNTVLLQTRLRGDVIYPSRFESFTESLTGHFGKNPGYDPLAFAIKECHKRGLELHAWLVTIPAGNVRQVKEQGSESLVHQNAGLCKKHENAWYLDPGNPGTEKYLRRLVNEIVSQYDVDGIHLDYIRYPENAQKFPDQDTYRKYGKGQKKKQWRRENITSIVRGIYQEVKALKPWVKVSSSPVGKFKDTSRYSSRGWNALHTVYQDAQSWLEEGIQDILFPMMYFKGNHFYPFVLDWKEHESGRWVVPGLGVYFLSDKKSGWTLEEVNRQIYFIRQQRLAGQAYFRNEFLMKNTQGIWDEMKCNFYTSPAILPAMTWIDSIAPAAPTYPRMKQLPDGKISLTWRPSVNEYKEMINYHIYGSATFPVDINQSGNLLETYFEGSELVLDPKKGKRYFAITATDRYGNESEPTAFNQSGNMDVQLLNHYDLLTLPETIHGSKVEIRKVCGTVVSSIPFSRQISLERMPDGFYLVYVIGPNQEDILAGSILK